MQNQFLLNIEMLSKNHILVNFLKWFHSYNNDIAFLQETTEKIIDSKRKFLIIRAMNCPSPFNPSPGKSQLQCLMVRLNRSSRMFLSVRKKYA